MFWNKHDFQVMTLSNNEYFFFLEIKLLQVGGT